MIGKVSSHRGSSDRFKRRKKGLQVTPTPTPTNSLTPTLTPTPLISCVVTNGLQLFLDAGNVNSYNGVGTTVYDLAGNANSTLTNGVGYNSSNNGVFTFDGTNDYIDTNTSFASESFTLSAWIKCNDVTGYRMIFSKEQTGGWPWNYRLYLQQSNGYLVGDIAQSAAQSNSITYNTNLADNNWHHVTFIRSVTDNKMYLYVDGSLVSTANNTLTGTIQNSQELWIGRSAYAGAYNYIGSISSVVVYNRDLSSSEITQNYNCSISRFSTPTPTPTNSLTPTPSVTPTLTPTLTPSITPTNTVTPTNSLTPTPTQTVTPTITPTNSLTPTPTPSGSSSGIVTSNLIMELDASNYTSGTWTDETGNGNNGTINGATWSATNGGIFDFDGTNDTISIAHNSSLSLSTTVQKTIQVWVNFDALPASGQQVPVFGKLSSSFTYDGYWGGLSSNGGVVRCTTNGQSAQKISDSILTVTTGTWYLFTFMSQITATANTTKVYINTTEYITTQHGNDTYSESNPLYLGFIGSGVGSLYLNGKIGAAYFYTKGLTSAEVTQNYEATRARYDAVNPTPTPSPTPTVTPTNSSTPTNTPTVTPTVTQTNTPTVTPSVSPAVTPTATPTNAQMHWYHLSMCSSWRA